MRNLRAPLLLFVALLAGAIAPGCSDEPQKPLPTDDNPGQAGPDGRAPATPKSEPRKIMVDQILIAFDKPANTTYTNARSAAEAEGLVKRLQERIVVGADFRLLKEEYSDARTRDTGLIGQPFYIFNKNIRPHAVPNYGVVVWKACFPAIRTAVFGLDVGEVTLVPYHEKNCPQGWFLIKRLE